MEITRNEGITELHHEGIIIWADRPRGCKINLFIELDGEEILPDGWFDECAMDPNSKQAFYTTEEQLEEIHDKDLLPMIFEHLKTKLNKNVQQRKRLLQNSSTEDSTTKDCKSIPGQDRPVDNRPNDREVRRNETEPHLSEGIFIERWSNNPTQPQGTTQ